MAEFDIVIIGGGIAGASLGAEVAGERRVLIVEAEAHCGYHSTGRSAAFWLESYGGSKVALLSAASRDFLHAPPPDFADRGFLRPRGALHLSSDGWAGLPEGIESRKVERAELERMLPGVRPQWRRAVLEPGCADIDVAALHAAYLKRFSRLGGTLATDSRLVAAERRRGKWELALATGEAVSAAIVVDAAGAWADPVAEACGVPPLGIAPKRRTMVQLRIGRSGLQDLPLVDDSDGTFYFKGESDRSIWLSPHDEIATDPCDAAPEEIDVATAIDRFGRVVDWPIERVERRWAGLRSFAPDRLPVYGFDTAARGFFWCVGQGGFGIQTAPAAARLAASVLLGEPLDHDLAHIDPAIFSAARFG